MSPKRQQTDPLPATGTKTDVPHVGRAVQGCRCAQCAIHRREDRLAERDRRVIERYADAPMIDEPVWWLHKR
jgi:hypothetical protein